MKKIAIYDMDKTITRRATFMPFVRAVLRSTAPRRMALIPWAMIGSPDRKASKERIFRRLIGREIAEAELVQLARAFAAAITSNGVHRGAVERIAADRAEGCTLVLATASPDIYAREIGRLLGFDSVIATQQAHGQGTVLARIDGPNCYGSAKLDRIKAWLKDQGIARENAFIRFYSDHVSDAPPLHWADVAIAANPSRQLRKLAQQRGWEIVDF